MSREQAVYVAGHNGMVGSALIRRLRALGYTNIVSASRSELELTRQDRVEEFFGDHRITQVYMAAARVGGIHANNTYPAEFIYDNLMVQCNVVHSAHKVGIQKLMFLGSSCIYPREVPQPMQEEALLTGLLELTNQPYAVAKIAGIKLCESYNRQYGRDYRSVMPTNLYGPNDNFHPQNSHVLPALMRRFHEAARNGQEEVVVWGTGNAKREFLHVDEMAAASVYVMELPKDTYESVTEPMLSQINVGTGVDCTIRELAETMAEVTGFQGRITFDRTKPDGPPRKLLDVSKLERLGWKSRTPLREGLAETYSWFLAQEGQLRT